MATVLTVITASMRLIGALAQGETPSVSEATDALSRLNLLLANWSIERINIYQRVRTTHALAGGTGSYTIGTGGTFNLTRPVKIDAANVIQTAGNQTPLKVASTEEWSAIEDKTAAAVAPMVLYDDYAYPLSTLYLWPKPSGAPTLELFSWQQLTGFSAVTDTFDFPPGYQQAIEYNLAALLAPEYGREIPPAVASIAGSSRGSIAQLNTAAGLPAAPPPEVKQ
jgi:hypothetical protein